MKYGRPNEAWIGTHHKRFGFIKNKIYAIGLDRFKKEWDFKEPMFKEAKKSEFDQQESKQADKAEIKHG